MSSGSLVIAGRMGETVIQSRRIVFVAQRRAEVERYNVDFDALGPEGVWIKTRYSLVSGGTEGAAFENRNGDMRYPTRLGYAAVGEVLKEGRDFPEARAGQLVLTYSPHEGIARASGICVPLPAGLDPAIATFARLASVAMTAVWVSTVQLGDAVAVIGLGVVGNLCAQLFQNAGAEVIGIDRSARRVQLGSGVGLRHTVQAMDDAQVRKDVLALTEGLGTRVTVEAVGHPALAVSATGFTRKLGEVILLGSPRGEHITDVTAMLNKVHLWDNGCLTLKGAHEWRFPVRDRGREDPNAKHSLEDNTKLGFRMLADGRLRVSELLTHIAAPSEAQSVYTGVCSRQDEYLGVLFDWQKE